jgi:hypothetical protein
LPITIRNHVSSLYHKIGVYRRGVGIIWARERGNTHRRSGSRSYEKKDERTSNWKTIAAAE